MTTGHPLTPSPLNGMTVLDAMRPGVVTCLPDDRLVKLATIMVTHGIHAVIVAPFEHRAPLIVTDLELVRGALERGGAARASEIARDPVTALGTGEPLEDAVALMAERYVAHLLATDPGSGAPAGIVSSFDVAAVLGGVEPRLARMLRPAVARPSPSERTLRQARAGDVMHPGVVTCAANAVLPTVARSMADYRVHCVAVAGIERPGQHLTWGLIGDMDVVVALHRGALAEPVASIAARSPIAVEENESLERVAALMDEHDTSHVVVVAGSGLPAGIVSTLDVVRILAAGA
jgi:CBS domain-containing protein